MNFSFVTIEWMWNDCPNQEKWSPKLWWAPKDKDSDLIHHYDVYSHSLCISHTLAGHSNLVTPHLLSYLCTSYQYITSHLGPNIFRVTLAVSHTTSDSHFDPQRPEDMSWRNESYSYIPPLMSMMQSWLLIEPLEERQMLKHATIWPAVPFGQQVKTSSGQTSI